MTEKELNTVRDLHKRIRDLERHIRVLRLSVENIVPVLDGLPHSTTVKSRVERLALNIADSERELSELREELIQARSILAEIIMVEIEEPLLQTLLLLRYVSCLSFKEIARRMRYGLRHIYKIHERFLKDGTIWHLAAFS